MHFVVYLLKYCFQKLCFLYTKNNNIASAGLVWGSEHLPPRKFDVPDRARSTRLLALVSITHCHKHQAAFSVFESKLYNL